MQKYVDFRPWQARLVVGVFPLDFRDPDILKLLDGASEEEFDAAPFGVVRMDRRGIVVAYNRFEWALSGLTPARIVGKQFFEQVALWGVAIASQIVGAHAGAISFKSGPEGTTFLVEILEVAAADSAPEPRPTRRLGISA
jgi:PAS domain-containing protein